MKSENFEMALDEIIWLITLLANQSVMIYNLKIRTAKGLCFVRTRLNFLHHRLTLPSTRVQLWIQCTRVQREILRASLTQKYESRVTDDELFTRLLYYGLAHLDLSQDEVWLMPFGLLLDLWECHRQYNGIAKPKRDLTIDDVIPFGV